MEGDQQMNPRSRMARFSALSLLVLALALTACGGSSAPPTNTAAPAAASKAANYAGMLTGTDAFIALTTTDAGAALAYVCDSQQISSWFSGTVSGSNLDLTAPSGAHLKAALE